MPIRLIHGASFDPATTQLLGLAYERAWENVGWDVTAREALAKRIIEAAKRRECDLQKLTNYGLGKTHKLRKRRPRPLRHRVPSEVFKSPPRHARPSARSVP